MGETRPTTLLGAATTFWRAFLPIWAAPVALFLAALGAERLRTSPWIAGVAGLLCAALTLAALFRAARPWLEERIGYWHFAFWTLLVPFLVWIAAVVARTAVQRLLTRG